MNIEPGRSDFALMEAMEPRRLLTAGVLDSAFGDGGIATRVFDGGAHIQGQAVVVGRDGRVVVAGNATVEGGTPIVSMARYLPDGTLDTSFGINGRASSSYGYVSAMAMERDGKIITAGGDSSLVVERFLADGALDQTFHPLAQAGPGIARIALTTEVVDTRVRAMVVRRDGRILLAVEFAGRVPDVPNYQGALVQLGADGELDNSFGDGGVLKFGTAGGDGEVKISALLLQDDGQAIAVGGTAGDFVVMRVSPEGSLDSTFGTPGGDGLTHIDFGTASDAASALLALRDGRIVVVGNAGDDLAIERLLPGGAPDPSLGQDGGVIIPSGLHTVFNATSVQLMSRRRIQINGTLTHAGTKISVTNSEAAALQVLADGQVDRAFGYKGLARIYDSPAYARLAGAAPTPDGGTILTVNSRAVNDLVTAKVKADGNGDLAFGHNPTYPGLARTSFTGTAGMILYDAIALRSGKIMTIADRSAGDLRGRFFVARWNADGTLDTSFGSDGTGSVVYAGFVPDHARLFEQRHGNVLAVFNNYVGPGLASIAPDGTITPQREKDRVFIPDFYVTNSTMDSAGRILIAGTNKLVRLTAGGALDLEFGNGGIIDLPFDPSSVAALPDGKVIVAGVVPGSADVLPFGRVELAQYLANGQPDPAFGEAGVMVAPLGANENQDSNPQLAVQKNGRVILAISRVIVPTTPEGERFGVIFGITSAGEIDGSFGNGGGQSAPIANGFGIKRIMIDPQQRVLALGLNDVDPSPTFSVTNTSVTRLTEDGQLDETFGSQDGQATISDSGAEPTAIALEPDGGIIAAAHNYRGKISLSRFGGDAITAQIVSGTLQITSDGTSAVRIRLHVNGNSVTVDDTPQTFDRRTFSHVVVRTGAGDDFINLSPLHLPADIDGGYGNDFILGGSADDSISGNAGNDTIFSGGGSDTVRGGEGNDYLNAGPGADQIFGENGNDQIFATDGSADTIEGGDGFDRAKTDTGDLLSGTEGLLVSA